MISRWDAIVDVAMRADLAGSRTASSSGASGAGATTCTSSGTARGRSRNALT